MVYVSFESPAPKSLAQLVEELKKIQGLEQSAIAALSDAVDGYRACCPSPEYWEGLLSQVLALFPSEVVKKQVGIPADSEAEFELAETRLEAGREIEDLRENVVALERELTEVRSRNTQLQKDLEYGDILVTGAEQEIELLHKELAEIRDELRATLEDPEAEEAILLEATQTQVELIEQLEAERDEWKGKFERAEKGLFEEWQSTLREKNAEIEAWKLKFEDQRKERNVILDTGSRIAELQEEKSLIVQGFNERIALFEQEMRKRDDKIVFLSSQVEKYQELEQLWSNRFVKQSEEIVELRKQVAGLPSNAEEPAETAKPDTYCEMIALDHNIGYLKVTETGEILAGYVGLKKVPGKRVKSLATKWADHINGLYGVKTEARPATRLKGFDYEIKITGMSIGQLTGLRKCNFSQYPLPDQQFELLKVDPFDPLCPEYHVRPLVPFNDEYGRVWKIPGKPNAWKHNLFNSDSQPFSSADEAANDYLAMKKERDAAEEKQQPDEIGF